MGVVIIERKRLDGTSSWHVRWNRRRHDRPRQIHLGTWPAKKFAVAQQTEALYMLARTGTVDVDSMRRRESQVLVKDLAEQWLASEHTGESSMKLKRAYCDRIVERWGGKAPANVNKADVQGWINDLVKLGKSEGTINNHLGVLRPMLRSADLDPIWLRGGKYLNIPRDAYEDLGLPDRLQREGCRAHLLEGMGSHGVVSPTRQAIFDVIEHGGLRTAEACELVWRQVGLIDGHPALLQIGTKFVSKGRKKPRNVRHMPEIDQPMWVPVKPDGVNPDDLVFPGVGQDAFTRAVSSACRRAGVKPFTPKALRHLHATRLSHWRAQHGLSVFNMAERMGHEQSLFEDLYSNHPLPD